MTEEKIHRINELYKKKKEGTLTPEEKEEQAALRAEYVQAVRNNLRNPTERFTNCKKRGRRNGQRAAA